MQNSMVNIVVPVEVIEELSYGKKEWITVKFPNGDTLTIEKKYCKEVKSDIANG